MVRSVRTKGKTHTGVHTFKDNIILQNDIYNTAWTDYGATSTVVGFSGTPTKNIWYKKIGKMVFVNFSISGSSNATNFTFTVPYTSSNSTNGNVVVAIRFGDNNGDSTVPGKVRLPLNSDTVTLNTDMFTGIWTAASSKYAMGQFWYEAA